MNFLKLDFGISNYFDQDFKLTWQDGPHGYQTLYSGNTGNTGLNNRVVTDSSKFLNYFTSNFISTLNETRLEPVTVSSYKLNGVHDGKLCRHTVEGEEVCCLFVLHGSASISCNTHDVSNINEYGVPDANTVLYHYINPGDQDTEGNFLSCSQVPILETYTDTAFIADQSVAHSFTNLEGTGYVTIVVFSLSDRKSLESSFSKYII